MLIKVSSDSSVMLEYPEDFNRFSVSIDASAEHLTHIREAVAGVGNLIDGEAMWVNEAWLRSAPGSIEGEQWQDAVSVMIAKAKQYGWVDEANRSIKAHVVWTVPAI